MNRLVGWVRTALREIWALVVDDWILAVSSLAAIGATFAVSRIDAVGSGNATGWLLVALVVTAVAASVRRAVAARLSPGR